MSQTATAKATEELSDLGAKLTCHTQTPIPATAKAGMSGGVAAKTFAGSTHLGLWTGVGGAKTSFLAGGLFGKSVAGSMASVVIGSGGASMIPAAVAGISVGATLMAPFVFAGAVVGFAGSSIGKKVGRGSGKSWLAGLLPPLLGGAKSGRRSKARRSSITSPVSRKQNGIIGQAMETARDLFNSRAKEEPFEFDRRFALRIKVPPGEMIVHGVDSNGRSVKGLAIDISMHGVRFSASKTRVKYIDRVVFPRYDVTLKVKEARIYRQAGNRAVAIMETFENEADGWMQWIELMTRLDQKQ